MSLKKAYFFIFCILLIDQIIKIHIKITDLLRLYFCKNDEIIAPLFLYKSNPTAPPFYPLYCHLRTGFSRCLVRPVRLGWAVLG